METLSVALLPLVLGFIMFALGLSMRLVDMKYVLKAPKPFLIGFVSQLIILPLFTLLLIVLLKPDPVFAFGFMLLSFCPGGITSNVLSKLVNGNLALSVALTSVMSLVSIVTVPILTTIAYSYYLGSESGQVSMLSMGLKMFFITALPVGLGILVNEKAKTFSDKHRSKFMKVALVLFVLLALLAIFSNHEVLLDDTGKMIMMTITLIMSLFIIGIGIPKLLGVSWHDAKTLGIEVGIQNSTMAIALSGVLAVSIGSIDTVLPAFALPAAIYSVIMYLLVVPYILLFRKFE
ncbi:bile acid:sodium symporter [Psychrobacter sp.]|uniref:bile acid:sodium symporter family protein n=1 Tax=Psychrobacter sp. TaxID=56811 RepID=UPI0025FDC556|nr:bile acid:sodium symporter [Psychrobacter sp.]